MEKIMKKVFNDQIIVTRLSQCGPLPYNSYKDCENCIQKKLEIDKDLWGDQHLEDKISEPFVVTYEEMTQDFKEQRKVSNAIRRDIKEGPTSIMRRLLLEEMETARKKYNEAEKNKDSKD
jgi:hypothetical protein